MSDDEKSVYSDEEISDNENSDDDSITPKKSNPSIRDVGGVDDYEPDDADESSEEDDAAEDDDENSDEDDVAKGGGCDDDSDRDSDIEIDDDGEPVEKVSTKVKSKSKTQSKTHSSQKIIDDDEEDDNELDDSYLQKFDTELVKNYIDEFHPECLNHNYEEIRKMSVVTKNPDGIIVDPLHKTIPYLTKYERARILGQRATQIENGAKPMVNIGDGSIIDSYIIADLELREKKIPFIIRRPIPGGGSEYWNLKDLEFIAF